MEEKKYLKTRNKIAYGSGDFASNLAVTFVGSFILFYLTESVGLNSAVVGALMLAAKLFDGVSDVIFGSILDKTNTKMGKARPWMLWSAIPLALCEFLMFSIPQMGETLQYVYFFIFYTLFNAVCYTANNIAYCTLSALITNNKNERVQLGVIRFIFAFAATIAISYTTTPIVTAFGGGASGWRAVTLIYVVLLLIINTISVLGVKELPESELVQDKTAQNKTDTNPSMKHVIKCLLKNRYYLLILGVYIVNFIYNGVYNGVGIYFMKYVIGNESMLGTFSMMNYIPLIIGLAVTPSLTKRFGIYKCNLVGMIFSTLIGIPMIYFGQNDMVTGMLICTALRGLGCGPAYGTLNALVAEASGYTYRTEGLRIDGMMFSCSSMGVKIGTGLGSVITGWLLTLGGYVSGAEAQTAGAIQMIRFMYTTLPIIFFIVITIFLWGLNVEKANKMLDSQSAENGK